MKRREEWERKKNVRKVTNQQEEAFLSTVMCRFLKSVSGVLMCPSLPCREPQSEHQSLSFFPDSVAVLSGFLRPENLTSYICNCFTLSPKVIFGTMVTFFKPQSEANLRLGASPYGAGSLGCAHRENGLLGAG